jgi:hypothetical protein
MIIFKFRLAWTDNVNCSIDSYSRGHMSIQGQYGTLNSTKLKSDQSMFIFFSIVDLLDGVRQFSDEEIESYNFVASDSSFQFFLEKNNDSLLLTDVYRRNIAKTTLSEISVAIWNGVDEFLRSYESRLDSSEPIAEDLFTAVKDFRAFIETL